MKFKPEFAKQSLRDLEKEMDEYEQEILLRTEFVDVGKTYIRRDGKRITIDGVHDNNEFPLLDSANGNAYRPNGTHGGYWDRDWDIMEEV